MNATGAQLRSSSAARRRWLGGENTPIESAVPSLSLPAEKPVRAEWRRRTALVAPWEKAGTLPLSAKPDGRADVVAQLQPGVLASIKTCNGKWCRLVGQGFDGWLPQDKLWGAYPTEKLD